MIASYIIKKSPFIFCIFSLSRLLYLISPDYNTPCRPGENTILLKKDSLFVRFWAIYFTGYF